MLNSAIAVLQNIVKLSYSNQPNYDYSNFPPHILAKIFSHLDIIDLKNSALVCKSWYYATCDIRIAKRLTVWIKPEVVNMDFLCRPIKSIRFHSPQFNKFYYRRLIQTFSGSITTLNIYCDKVLHTSIFEMISHLPNLVTIEIYDGGSYYFASNFHHHKIISRREETLIKHLARLKNLEITTLLKNLEPYKLFWRHCKNLEKLHWKRNHEYTELEFKEFIESFLNLDENQTLKNVNELAIHNICKKWNSHFFERMVHLNLTNVKKLIISEVSSTYYDVMFKEFCKTYKQLIKLQMDGCNDQQLYDICQYITTLNSLAIRNCEANNLQEIANLKSLERLTLDRIFYAVDDGLLLLLKSKPKYLKYLEMNIVSTALLTTICETLPDLEVLKIEQVETKDCEVIYRNLIKLENLFIRFSEFAKCHSSQIKSSDEWNLLRLTRLRKLHISCFVPGITPDLIRQHPLLDNSCIFGVWNPTEEDIRQQELADQLYLNEQNDEIYDVTVRDSTESFEISDFEWFAAIV